MDSVEDPDQSESQVSLDEALERTGFGKFNYTLIILTGAILGCVFLETVSINFILPVAQCELNLSNRDKGILSTISFIGIILSSHLWGFLADTRGRKTVIVPTLITAFVITIISSLTKPYWLLVLLRFLNGFFVSGPSATVFAYLGEFHPASRRLRVMMMASVIYAVSMFYNPVFAEIIINQDWSFYIETLDLEYKPWRLFMVVCGVPNVICALFTHFFMPESPKFLFSRGDERKTLEVLEKIYKRNSSMPVKKFSVTSLVKDEEFHESGRRQSTTLSQFMWSQTEPLFKHPHLKNTLKVCFIQFSIYNTSNGFWTFFPEITHRVATWLASDPGHVTSTICHILSETKAAASVNGTMAEHIHCVTKLESSAYKNAYILSFVYFFGWSSLALIINRVGKRIILVTLLCSCGLCAFAIIFVTHPTVSSYLYIALMADALALSVVNASCIELFPTKFRAMALCLSMMSGRLGAVIGSNIIGLLLDENCEYTFLMPTILLISSGLLAFTIPNISTQN